MAVKMKKLRTLCIFMLCCMMLMPMTVSATAGNTDTPNQEENPDEDNEDEIIGTYTTDGNIMIGGNWVTPTCVYGQQVNVVVPLVNMGKKAVTKLIVTPIVDSSSTTFPFEIEKSNYSVQLDTLLGEECGLNAFDRRQEVTYTFKTRADVTNGYKSIKFRVQYVDQQGNFKYTELPVYVYTQGAPGASTDGEEEKTSKSTPRVIVSGFTTNPEVVQAGDNFTLTLHIKNTSARTAVSNVEFNIEAVTEGKDEATTAPAFLPVSGSNTIFVNSIPAGGSTDISMDLSAKADLAQKPYVVKVSMQYEDDKVNPFTTETSVSIPVKQESRMEVSEPEVMPNSIEVGSQSNVMFSIYNTGKTKLYNVSVKFAADSVSGGDAFVGNLESGATGNVDVMVNGAQATLDDGKVKINITYEDETGAPTTIEKEIELFVNEMPVMDPGMMGEDGMIEGGMIGGEEMPSEGGQNSKMTVIWIIGGIAAVIVIAVIVIVVIKKKSKKKKEAQELEELEKSIEEEEK